MHTAHFDGLNCKHIFKMAAVRSSQGFCDIELSVIGVTLERILHFFSRKWHCKQFLLKLLSTPATKLLFVHHYYVGVRKDSKMPREIISWREKAKITLGIGKGDLGPVLDLNWWGNSPWTQKIKKYKNIKKYIIFSISYSNKLSDFDIKYDVKLNFSKK